MEAGGCDDYGALYGLTDQLHAVNRKNSNQKTIKDYMYFRSVKQSITVITRYALGLYYAVTPAVSAVFTEPVLLIEIQCVVL